ncbi:hypothetical protein IMZ48_33470 [Candidatus Bathyarchaeota archaeon]|nr:hypothetical protein [Candidatus Bathyarchaeota archaeon]
MVKIEEKDEDDVGGRVKVVEGVKTTENGKRKERKLRSKSMVVKIIETRKKKRLRGRRDIKTRKVIFACLRPRQHRVVGRDRCKFRIFESGKACRSLYYTMLFNRSSNLRFSRIPFSSDLDDETSHESYPAKGRMAV